MQKFISSALYRFSRALDGDVLLSASNAKREVVPRIELRSPEHGIRIRRANRYTIQPWLLEEGQIRKHIYLRKKPCGTSRNRYGKHSVLNTRAHKTTVNAKERTSRVQRPLFPVRRSRGLDYKLTDRKPNPDA